MKGQTGLARGRSVFAVSLMLAALPLPAAALRSAREGEFEDRFSEACAEQARDPLPLLLGVAALKHERIPVALRAVGSSETTRIQRRSRLLGVLSVEAAILVTGRNLYSIPQVALISRIFSFSLLL